MSFGWIIFAVMVGVFLFAAFYKHQPIGISLLFGAIAGSIVSQNGLPIRHLVEGIFTYFDPILIIFTAMLFMKVIESNGALKSLAGLIVRKFSQQPAAFVLILMLFIMFPAMLTGITTTSVLTTGALMAPAMIALGIPVINTAAMVALVSLMGMVAPPINLLVMLIGQGVDMPYIGFEGPLSAMAFPLAIITSFGLSYKYIKSADHEKALRHIASGGSAVPSFKLFLPLIVVFVLMISVRIFNRVMPDIGAPLIFVIGAIIGMFTGSKISIHKVVYRSLLTGLPVIGLLAGIGAFLQIMTLTGVRGLLVVTVLSLPVMLTYIGLLISLPVFGGVSAFASAMVFGIPFLLSLLGSNEIVVCSGIAMLAALGDVLPPSAIEARFGAQIVGEKNFMKVVIKCLPFTALFALVGLAVIYFSNALSFLTP